MSKAKEELAHLIEQQPDDSSREKIVRELTFHVMVRRGLTDADAGRSISNDEMGRRIRTSKLVETIWESIPELPEALHLPKAQEAELDRRLGSYRKDPTVGSPWPEVKARILKRA